MKSLLVLLLVVSAAAGCQEAAIPCESQNLPNVVRIDKENKRIFLTEKKDKVEGLRDVKAALRYFSDVRSQVAACWPEWKDSWSVSIFSEARYAGYKDEETIIPFVRDGSWQASYLADYDEKTRALTLYPLQPEKRRTLRVVSGR